jgi:DNA polymerase I-like protein with 3'-5' exonuclease and polymerase domains
MGFEFGNINTSIKKKNQDLIVDNISYLSQKIGKGKHLLFLLEHPIESPMLKLLLINWIKKNFPDFDIDIVSASAINASDEQIKKQGIYRFYLENKSNFDKYIRENTIIIPFGYALSAITQSFDLSVDCFYDHVFNKTYFFSPQTNTYVFPIDSIGELFKSNIGNSYSLKDCSRVYFALYQFQQVKNRYEELKTPPVPERLQIKILKTKEDWSMFYVKHLGPGLLSWDLETTGLNYLRDKVICITMSFDGKTGYFIPWNIVNKEELDELFKDKTHIGQTLKFDVKFLKNLGLKNIRIDEDTHQLSQLLNEMRFNSLKSLAYYYTSYGGYDAELDRFKDRYNPKDYGEIPFPIMSKYAAMDAIIAYLVYKEMHKQLEELDIKFKPIHTGGWSMKDFYYKIKIPSCNSFTNIEMKGLYVDEEKWDENAKVIEDKINSISEKLRIAFGIKKEEIASLFPDDEEEGKKSVLQSGMKLGKILEAKGWECLGRAKAKYYLTGDAQLERWKQLGHPEATLLQDLRSYLTMQKTFIGKPNQYTMGWRRYVEHHPDGSARIHPIYKPMLMDTMRNGCSDPNFQQGPASAKDAKLFKQVYSVPNKDDYYLVTLDYASMQMRLAAVDSEDPVLFNGYIKDSNLDVHSKTAFNVFCREAEFDLEEIVVKDQGKTKIFFPHEEVKIIRNGKSIKIKATELMKEDVLKW